MQATKTTAAHIGNVTLLPLALITTREQVRTRNGFDRESLGQLASSIAQYGVLQPIVVRRDPEQDEGYIVVYGHRRFAASSLAKLEMIPAIIADQEPAALTEIQLAENLQRENLNLADTADAVRKLFQTYKKAGEVAKRVHKSASWVSKHLALTRPDFDQAVHTLMESNTVQDIEILHTLNQIAKHKNSKAPKVLNGFLTRAVNEQLSRADVREALTKLQEATEPASTDNDEGEAETDADADESTDTKTANLFETITLQVDPETFAKYMELGGAAWFAKQLQDA